MIDQLFDLSRWQGVPLAAVVRQTFPVVVASYRGEQGLIRAMLEQASDDPRFREEWSTIGKFMVEHVTRVVMNRSFEVNHPDPVLGVRLGLETVFGMLALRILMHEIDEPEMEELTEELIRLMLRYMGIADVPDWEQQRKQTF